MLKYKIPQIVTLTQNRVSRFRPGGFAKNEISH